MVTNAMEKINKGEENRTVGRGRRQGVDYLI